MVSGDLFSDITDDHLRTWRATWVPARPVDFDWSAIVKWARSFGLGKQKFSVFTGDDLQGLLVVDVFRSSRMPEFKGRNLVYVEFLAAAPWNRLEYGDKRQFCGVGSLLMRVAVELSMSLEFKGRVGLHSVAAAETFYAENCGMTSLGPDEKKQNLTYYEMTENQAQQFLL